MVAEKYAVRLSPEDQAQLERLIRRGQCSARVINRARILLKTDDGWSASQVAVALDTSPRSHKTKANWPDYCRNSMYPEPSRTRNRRDSDSAQPYP